MIKLEHVVLASPKQNEWDNYWEMKNKEENKK